MNSLIASIPFRDYQLADYLHLSRNITRFIEERAGSILKDSADFTDFKQTIDRLERSMRKPSTREFTMKIEELRLDCTRAHSAFKHYVKAHINHPKPELAQAAKSLLNCIQEKANYLGKSGRLEQSTQLSWLVKTLKKHEELQEAIDCIGAHDWVNQMEISLRKLRGKIDERTDLLVDSFKENASDIVLELRNSCRFMINYIEVLHRNKMQDMSTIIDLINEVIRMQKVEIAKRKAIRKRKVSKEPVQDWEGWE